MRLTFRPILAVSLALVLVLTSGAMAVARGQAKVAGEIVICTGQGIVTVAVDENGQPTGPAHICPDCALGLFDHAAGAPDGVRPAALGTACLHAPGEVPDGSFRNATPRARAPPRA